MKDVRHHIAVGAVWDPLEEIPRADLTAIRNIACRQHRLSVSRDRRHFEQNATQMGMPAQNGRQQDPSTATDVYHGSHARKVVSGGDARSERRSSLGHGGVEVRRVLRVSREELEDTHPGRS